jgi:hypothetical protein
MLTHVRRHRIENRRYRVENSSATGLDAPSQRMHLIPCHGKLISMSSVSRIAFATILVMFVAGVARAQDVTIPPPDASYGNTATSYPSPTDLTMPPPDDFTNPDVVTIPIPGGGDVTVDGPAAVVPKPPAALSQWGLQQQNPFSHGTGPLGP